MADAITLPPLPIRSCIVTYMGDGRGLHYTLGVAAGTALIEQPPGSQLDFFTADQLRAHAAAVSAADNAALREDAERYHEWKRAFREGECALWNALCECQSDAEHDAAIDAALAARKGEATTPPPSPSPRS